MKVYDYIMELGFVHKTSSELLLVRTEFIENMGDYIDTVRKHGL